MSLNNHAGELVAKYRKKQGLSQADLAELMGMTRTSMSNIEHGKQAMSLVTFCRIADYLHISPVKLLQETINLNQRGVSEEDVPYEWLRDILNQNIPDSINARPVKGAKK